MAKKLIERLWTGNVEVKVYLDKDWDEYLCCLSIDGKVHHAATYHTADKDDAINTASAMLNDAWSNRNTY